MENSPATRRSSFQYRFSVNVWNGFVDYYLILPHKMATASVECGALNSLIYQFLFYWNMGPLMSTRTRAFITMTSHIIFHAKCVVGWIIIYRTHGSSVGIGSSDLHVLLVSTHWLLFLRRWIKTIMIRKFMTATIGSIPSCYLRQALRDDVNN